MKPRISVDETLLPALLQCFGIIFLGYLLGRTKVLRSHEASGLSKFVQYLSLPALIFVEISTTAFTTVKWEFIAAVFVTKACIFACVSLMAIILTHPPHLGKVGIFAIAVTQSNDFALGYPLLMSLYGNTHPKYPAYVYIIAPIQLLIFNTIGFFLIETEKHDSEGSRRYHFFSILKRTIMNPVVLMTLTGLIWNVTYGQEMLPIFNSILKAFSSAFPATALLLVGYTMSKKSETYENQIPLTVVLLVLMKNLVSPILFQKFSALMLEGSTDREIEDFSCFGFLYGTIPTAPTVYVFATQYEICVDIITKTIISSTLFSAPLMFASASAISLTQMGIKNTTFYISQTISYLGCANLFTCMWLLVLFLLGRHWKSINFNVTLHLVVTQTLTAIGGLLLFFSPQEHTVMFYAQYIITTGSIYATRMCTVLLAVLLLLARWRSLCYILQIKNHISTLSIVICYILPYAIAAALLIKKGSSPYDPVFQLGFIQILSTFILTLICLFSTILCLISQHVCFRKRLNKYNQTSYQQYTSPHHSSNPNTTLNNMCTDIEDLGKNRGESFADETEDLISDAISQRLCDSSYQCSNERRRLCTIEVTNYIHQQEKIGLYDDQQILKHTALLITLSIAMTLSLAVCVWKLMREDINGIYIELEFLDIIMSYSGGIVCFFVFGLDRGFLDIIQAKWLKLKHYYENFYYNESTSSPRVCEEFMLLYYEKCKMEIAQIITFNGTSNSHAFIGPDLIEWLLEAGIAREDKDAEIYCKNLLQGHVIQNLNGNENFFDSSSLFIFIGTPI
ncbi:integral membrane protein GPR155-like [Stegodyphus dumicola]|uniref:integral membrane protein GPR155-like n=1 Tax=Stegodyphus dumicola TaxID=202533 RepID=UPI0015A7F1FA|nr:integral membrane protein GPR155-like [Stegodyphus dumicola]